MQKSDSGSGRKKPPQGEGKSGNRMKQDDAAKYLPEDMDPGEAELLLAWGRHLEKDYPNPDRIGCPGTEVLKKIAARVFRDADLTYHIARCAPCSKELRELKYAAKKKGK